MSFQYRQVQLCLWVVCSQPGKPIQIETASTLVMHPNTISRFTAQLSCEAVFPRVRAKPESMYPKTDTLKSTRPAFSGDPAQNSLGHGNSGFALVSSNGDQDAIAQGKLFKLKTMSSGHKSAGARQDQRVRRVAGAADRHRLHGSKDGFQRRPVRG